MQSQNILLNIVKEFSCPYDFWWNFIIIDEMYTIYVLYIYSSVYYFVWYTNSVNNMPRGNNC